MDKQIIKIIFTLVLMTIAIPSFAAPPVPAYKKVMVVLFENEDAKKAMDQPAFRTFATKGANLTNLNAEVHPSQGNYIALVSGDQQGVRGDGNVNIDANHIGDLLEAAGRSWKIYLEGYPGNCFTGARSGQYVRKHNPFISFRNIQNDGARCAKHLVEAGSITSDIANGTLPDFSLYIPDLKNDGHDTGVAFASRWFGDVFFPFLSDERFMRDMLVIATFDESGPNGKNIIYGALYGESVISGSSSAVRYDHYSILRTIEDTLGLGTLGLKDQSAIPIRGIWR